MAPKLLVGNKDNFKLYKSIPIYLGILLTAFLTWPDLMTWATGLLIYTQTHSLNTSGCGHTNLGDFYKCIRPYFMLYIFKLSAF